MAAPPEHVVIGKRNVERIELGNEALWPELASRMVRNPVRRIGIIVASEIRCPLGIPRRFAVGSRVTCRRLFTTPEYRRRYIGFPWV